MPKFRIRSSSDEASAIEASDWSGAIAKLLGKISNTTDTVNIGVSGDGSTEIWADGDSDRYMLDTGDGSDSAFELSGVPTTELWDAPTPGSGASVAKVPNPLETEEIKKRVSRIETLGSDAEACEDALNLLLTHVPAESASVLLAEGSHLRFTSVRGPHSDALQGTIIPIQKGIAGAVAATGRTILVNEARSNPQHDASVDQSFNHITRTLLAVPISHGATANSYVN